MAAYVHFKYINMYMSIIGVLIEKQINIKKQNFNINPS